MRRLVLVCEKETPEFLRYFGVGLGNEIYTLEHLESLDPYDKEKILTLGPGDAALVVGSNAFGYLKEKYHFGVRSENYYDCSHLRRLSIEGGAYIKVVAEFPDTNTIQDFMSPEFTLDRDFSSFVQKVIHTYDEAMIFLKYFHDLPVGTEMGFDYETSGMPLDVVFWITGASICTSQYGAFFSFTDIRKELYGEDNEKFQTFKKLFADTLVKHQSHLWAYNLQFEQQVSWREFGVDLELCDAGVYNILDSLHLKKYSLKWTAQRILMVKTWDVDFDRLGDLFDSMYFTEVQKPGTKGKKNMEKVLKVTPQDYQNTPEWKEICRRYPNYISQFEELINDYFGQPFVNIPSDILGYYCNLDAFYTLMIHLEKKGQYTEKCVNVFLDNLRLGARLHSCGMYKDEAFRLRYDEECSRMMAFGITYCATARCKYKIEQHEKKANKLSKYNKHCQRLLERSEFFNGNVIEIMKHILSNNVDTNNTNDLGLNEGQLLLSYGAEFAEFILDTVQEVWLLLKEKGKITVNVGRKKKLFEELAPRFSNFLGLDKITLGEKHEELEKLIWYQKAYTELLKIWDQGLTIYNIPETFEFFGVTYKRDEYTEYVMSNYFKCSSPIESAAITKELTGLFRLETTWLSVMTENVNKLDEGESYYKNRGITTPQEGFEHFIAEYKVYCASFGKNGPGYWPQGYVQEYPDFIWQTASEFWKHPDSESMTTTWDNFDGFKKQTSFFPDLAKDYEKYEQPYCESDFLIDNGFFFMRKMILMLMMYKKYAKVKSTYINGLFLDNDKTVIDTPIFYPLRKAKPGEPGAVTKMFPRFQINEKNTKRWSSPYHTIISHSDIKSIIVPPKGHLEAYFDISGAETATIAALCKSKKMMDILRSGSDLYIHSASVFWADKWDTFDLKTKKKWRKKFKSIFLGTMYGMGINKLAIQVGSDPSEAKRLQDTLFSEFPELKQFMDRKMQYPLDHDGYLETMLGDTLRSDAWQYLHRSDGSIDNGAKAKVQRQGINYPIQSISACGMAGGFMNNIREAKEKGINLTPIICVHDSNTNYVPIDMLFDLRKHYDHGFSDYCYRILEIEFRFDLLVGIDYENAAEMKRIDDETIQFTGNAHTLLGILNKIHTESNLNIEIDTPIDQIIPNYIQDPMERFIREEGTSVIMDTSNYTIKLKKVA